jgi:predicted dehydrogenase
VPTAPGPGANRFEIYGRAGTLIINGGSLNSGPSTLQVARGKDALASLEIPPRFTVIPDSVPDGPSRNVAQAYVRLADALSGGAPFTPDFAHAVRRHALIEAIERSAAEARSVRVEVG